MSLKIVIGAGHGGGGVTPGKRSPAGEYEWDFNDAVVDGFMEEIDKYQGVEVMRVDDDDARDGYEDVPLSERVKKANAWGADLYISVHHNALNSKWGNHGGTETFYYVGSKESKKLAEVVHKAMMSAYKLRDRGLKDGRWLYVLKNTKMPAVLTEGGFMDSNIDIKVLRNRSILEQAGRNIAIGIAEWKGLKKRSGSASKPSKPAAKPAPSQKELYRVRKSWNDVKSQKGAFHNLNNAKQCADENPGYQVYDESGKVVYAGKQKTSSKPAPANPKKKKWEFAKVTLRRGSKGEHVRKMQEGLCAANFYPNKKAKNKGVDGIFGPDTENAVRRFQMVYLPYEVDGIFGPKTRAKLEEVLNK